MQPPSLSRKNVFTIRNFFEESILPKYRISASKTLSHAIKFKENSNNPVSGEAQPDIARMQKALTNYGDLDPLLLVNSPLDIEDKITVIARSLERRCHRVAQGDGDEYTSAISHTKFLVNQNIEGVSVPNTKKFANLAVTISDKGGLLDGKREAGTVIPAHYVWGYDSQVANPLELLLVGKKRKALVPPADTAVLEQAFRENKLKEKQIYLDRIGKVDASKQPFTRVLHLFGNELTVPNQWEKNQTNLFCSLFVDSSPQYHVYLNLIKQFHSDMEGHKILYIKQLQHALNFSCYNQNKEMQKAKGSADNEKLLFYGSGSIVPRTIVLGSAMDLWRAEAKKKGKFFTEGIELASDPWYADQFAYVCKNNQSGQSPGRKQMLVYYAALGNSKRVEKPALSEYIANDSLHTTLEDEYGRTSTVYGVYNPFQLYPILLIEYESESKDVVFPKSIEEIQSEWKQQYPPCPIRDIMRNPPAFEDYKAISCLGQGSEGLVFQCTVPGVEDKFALKMLFNTYPEAQDRFSPFANEFDILKSLPPHPNIIPLLCEYEKPIPQQFISFLQGSAKEEVMKLPTRSFKWIAVPHYGSESLREHLFRAPFIDKMMFISEIISAFTHLLANRVLYQHPKLENIFIHSGRVIIADFRTAIRIEKSKEAEIDADHSFSFALGVLALQILFNKHPDAIGELTLPTFTTLCEFNQYSPTVAHSGPSSRSPDINYSTSNSIPEPSSSKQNYPESKVTELGLFSIPEFYEWMKGLLLSDPIKRGDFVSNAKKFLRISIKAN